MQSKFSNAPPQAAFADGPGLPQALECLGTQPKFEIDTSVDSFALNGGGGVSAGFGVNSVLQAVGFGVNYSTGTLDMSMVMSAPLYGSNQVGNSAGSANSNNFSFNVSAVVDMINGSISAWTSTGLYALSQSALQNTFSNLMKNVPSTTWSAVLGQDLGNGQFTIPVGGTAGILVGDSFNIYKVNYIWSGNGLPCLNPLKIVDKLGPAFAVATVTQVSYTNAIVSISYPGLAAGATPEQTPTSADWLEINSLVKSSTGAKRNNLKYSLHLGTVSQSNNLLFSDGKTTENVSMTPFVATQLSNYVVNTLSQFYIQ